MVSAYPHERIRFFIEHILYTRGAHAAHDCKIERNGNVESGAGGLGRGRGGGGGSGGSTVAKHIKLVSGLV